MIKIQKTQFSFEGNNVSESEVSATEACRILHSLSFYERLGSIIICESKEDKKQLIKTYRDTYQDEFNIQHSISDEEQEYLRLAYPATNDVFYVENFFLRFEAGIRALDPRYARVNTHQTIFYFRMTPIFECLTIDNAPDEQIKKQMHNLQQYVIYKCEQLNHLSYEDAQEYMKQVWCAYQELFNDGFEVPDIEKIIAINKNFNIPWYDRLH